jgi:CPA1 family monovalent cation:H+ antiporter
MNDIELLLALVAVAVALVWVARALRVPYPIFLLAGGLALGVIPGIFEIKLNPDVVFLVFIPPLVHYAAASTSPRALRKLAWPITQLAIVLVVVTMGVVAVVAHALIGGLTWPAAFTLGAIVAPTDAVAATAIYRRLGVPPKVASLVEGESLLNDAAALVAYKIAVAATVAAGYSVLHGIKDLVVVSIGGVVVGFGVAWLIAQARRRIDDATIEIAVTLLTPYVAYIAAEQIGASGILSAVVSGLYLGWYAPDLFTATTRLQANAFWDTFTFLLESVLFILVGLQFPGVVKALDVSAGEMVLWAIVVAAVVILLRLPFVFLIAGLNSTMERAVRSGERKMLTRAERIVVGWSGMRGAVSLAAALAIPLTTDAGTPFPGRDVILFLTLSTIVITLLGQGFTLPALIKRLNVEDDRSSDVRRARARFATVQAALDHIADLTFDDGAEPGVVERARNMYTSRARQLAGQCQVGVESDEQDEEAWLKLRRHLLDVERGALRELRDEGRVPNRVVLDVERDLDLEDSRLQSQPFLAVTPEQTAPPPLDGDGDGAAPARSEGAPARGRRR